MTHYKLVGKGGTSDGGTRVSRSLDHIRSALAYRSPRLQLLLGEVLEAAEEPWQVGDGLKGRLGSSRAGTFTMQIALETLDRALSRDGDSAGDDA